MFNILENTFDLNQLNCLTKKLANNSNIGDIFLLTGELGVGKTTFTRLFINALFEKHLMAIPDNIKSPSFPILINYSLHKYEINHYDLYRLKNKNELIEIGILENIKNNITIIEWPDLIINNFKITNYYLIKFELIDLNIRKLTIFHSRKQKLNEF